MATRKQEEPPEATQLPADPKAEAKEERDAAKEERKEEREAAKAERKEERPTPFGKLAESDDYDDLPEPKPKRDLLPNHSPIVPQVSADEIAEYTQKRVDEEVARLQELHDANKADRAENVEEYKAEAVAAHDAAVDERRAERAGSGE